MTRLLNIAIAAIAFCTVSTTAEETRSPVAIVAHESVTADNLSLAELKRICLADQQFWPDRSRIILLVQAHNQYERAVVLDRIYDMSEREYKRYWVAKMFRAEVSSGPKIVFSSNMARELVSSLAGAITFISADEVQGHGKIISIDGMLPSDPDYPLR